ncbi:MULTISPECIES: AraC family transcriptional regulator [unclassified Brenneria]|uniref:AraC family transcriptional regulator n=1 Tax=unclassified Brenneria TaxID=2634434 RepID=UPI0029C478F6|nr:MULTISPECIES: AraC family transcriptional regulator [unclassified Brenneria]MDX5627286.1 AraC family transcriptional regulator [Brenneria sp. L3-3Z]MDX5694558.1 AraC family transcriptional regulator [Brenneria sp. L4-2C]
MSSVHTVKQSYWFSAQLPYVELRSTWHSAQGYKTHSHAQFSIGAIEQGATICHYRGEKHRLQSGDLIFIDPQQPHSCNPFPGQTRSYHMLYLDTDWCLKKLAELSGSPVASLRCRCVTLRSPALFADYRRLIGLLHQGEIAAARQTLNELIAPILRQYCVPVAQIERTTAFPASAQLTTRHVRRRLLTQLQEAPSLATLAEELNLRRETIVRHFRRHTGLTPMAFLNNARVEYAKTLLKQGVPLVDVSYQSGFCDQSHFHKIFVQYTAATPGQYRQARSIFDNK